MADTIDWFTECEEEEKQERERQKQEQEIAARNRFYEIQSMIFRKPDHQQQCTEQQDLQQDQKAVSFLQSPVDKYHYDKNNSRYSNSEIEYGNMRTSYEKPRVRFQYYENCPQSKIKFVNTRLTTNKPCLKNKTAQHSEQRLHQDLKKVMSSKTLYNSDYNHGNYNRQYSNGVKDCGNNRRSNEKGGEHASIEPEAPSQTEVKYVDAPLPTVNPWFKNKTALHSEQHPQESSKEVTNLVRLNVNRKRSHNPLLRMPTRHCPQ